MIKTCERCGKQRNMMSWEHLCYSCMKEKELERIQAEIADGEEPNTGSSDYVICPYCGAAYEQASYEDTPEMYDEGDQEIECYECGKVFRLTTSISYYYETVKIK